MDKESPIWLALLRERLSQLGFRSYDEYLRSDHWRKVRRRCRKVEALRRCYICRSENDIQLHHRNYTFLGREGASEAHLIALCGFHHQALHQEFNAKVKTRPQTSLWKFTKLYLRRERLNWSWQEDGDPGLPSPREIEILPKTRVNLTKWGVSWPPPKGWKKELLEACLNGRRPQPRNLSSEDLRDHKRRPGGTAEVT
jgi:hypothetical protein